MKRLRVFAGPNGSGKSTLFDLLRSSESIHTSIYLSADRFEKTLREKQEFSFNAYRIKVTQNEFEKHIIKSTLLKRLGGKEILNFITIESGILKSALKEESINSYLASFITSFLAEKLIATGQSFSFETVMSHESKLWLIKRAKQAGYRTYLYFIATKSPELNVSRVATRVKQGGHDVAKQKIIERYGKSLKLMRDAIGYCNRSYIIDNTNNFDLIVSYKEGKVTFKADFIPEWVKNNIKNNDKAT